MNEERLVEARNSWIQFRDKCKRTHRFNSFTGTPEETHEHALQKFWNGVSVLSTPEEKMAGLHKMTRYCCIRPSDKQLLDRRNKFERKKRYLLKVEDSECFVCGSINNLHRHHVIPMKNGGSNNPLNLVSLCNEHHRELHPWMGR